MIQRIFKSLCRGKDMNKEGGEKKRGQVTIFIIVGIVIVALGVLVFTFFPEISSTLGLGASNPQEFMQGCMQNSIRDAVEKLSLQGGSVEPEHYFLYENSKVDYLCYTREYYVTCAVQRPLLEEYVEEQIKEAVKDKADECLVDLKSSYERKGYSVEVLDGDFNIEIFPERVLADFNNSIILEKSDAEKYDFMRVSLNSNLYGFLVIADSVMRMEAEFGDSETTFYMDYYRDLKMEKKKQSDGTTIYILTKRTSREKFQFASRSLAWPPGYGSSSMLY